MSGCSRFFAKFFNGWRRRSEYRTLAALSAASAMLAAFRLSEPLLDDPVVSSVGDVLLAPVLVAITCALTLSARRSNTDPESLAPVARMLNSLRPSLGIVCVLRGVLQELVQLTGAREIVVVLENRAARRLTSARLSADALASEPTLEPLARSERPTYFFPLAGADDDADGAGAVRMVTFDHPSAALPDAFTSAHPFTRMHAASFNCGDAWHGRLFILDPKRAPAGSVICEFEVLLSQLMPAVAGIGDLHGVKRRAAAQERNRLARDLHDGVVQELMNVDVEIEILRRRPTADWLTVRRELGDLQEQIRRQVTDLRGLLNDARSHNGTTSTLPTLLGEVVHRFGRESGISAGYRCTIEDLKLPRRVSAELVHIAQEALINVRRHSGARHVVVNFTATDDQLTLGVEDDGRGFPSVMNTPAIVTERVQAIGGTTHVMAVEHGARIEIRLPRKGPWTTTAKRFELSSPTITRFFETG
jgi:signal transduction histidine kinase